MKHDQKPDYIALGLTAFAVIAASILLFFVIHNFAAIRAVVATINRILRPIYYGMVLAFLLLPVHRRILKFLHTVVPERMLRSAHHRSFLNAAAITLSLLFAFLVVYILLAMVLPQVYTSIVGLINAFPGYAISVQNYLTDFFQNNPDIQAAVLPYYDSAVKALEEWFSSDMAPNLQSANGIMTWLQDEVLPQLTGVFTSVSVGVIALVNLVKDLLIALIVSVYLLVMKDTFSAQAKKITYSLLGAKKAEFVVEEVRNAYGILSGFINGKLLDSLIIGIIALVCCNILKFPYPMLLAVIIGVTNIIPFFGPFIGAIPCALLILLVSPIQCVYFCIFVLVLQQFDGNILGPKILGDSTGLASFWVLFSILLAGGLFGFAGMVLGVPVFAMFYSVVRRLVNFGLRKRGLPTVTDVYRGMEPVTTQHIDRHDT